MICHRSCRSTFLGIADGVTVRTVFLNKSSETDAVDEK
jgi:hypothetical protein